MGRLFSIVVCALSLLGATRAEAQTTAIFFHSETGDPIGRGVTRTWVAGELTFTASHNIPTHVLVHAENFSPGSSTWWDLEFAFPDATGPVPGAYDYAGDAVFGSPMRPGLRISGSGSGCSPNGRFVVHEVVFDSAGKVVKFAADFEQHCDDRIPALFGAVRFNSSRSSLTPFDGAYPVDALHVDPSPYGRVTGTGVDCGDGGVDCDESFSSATTVALTATPAPGYAFLGWTGHCLGKLTPVSVVVAQPKKCAAVFDALPGSGQPPPFAGGTAA